MATKGTRCPAKLEISPRHTVSQYQWLPRESGMLERWRFHRDTLWVNLTDYQGNQVSYRVGDFTETHCRSISMGIKGIKCARDGDFTEANCRSISMATKGTRYAREMAISLRHPVDQSQYLPREPGAVISLRHTV